MCLQGALFCNVGDYLAAHTLPHGELVEPRTMFTPPTIFMQTLIQFREENRDIINTETELLVHDIEDHKDNC
ncbi:hypothetical protein SAMN05443582_10714 [Phyllobacterium sp. OV277]|nr:hypothetical protein SAMN05443582_10714 [Phyllobacterium sp. OV277]